MIMSKGDRPLPPPGVPPFTRGIYPEMYRTRLWTMRQYTGYATSQETNRRFHHLLASGQTGLSVAFDLPTQIGYDPDHPLSEGEVGRVGVSIVSVEDMERLFEGIRLEEVSTSMTINATAGILLAFYLIVARRQGADWARLRGTLQNDILKEYIARGTYRFPPEPSLRLVVDIIRFTTQYVPQWYPISISGYHIREAGATAVQEVAYTLANGIAYVEAAQKRGLDVDIFGPRISFFFNAHIRLLEEVAKFRAARRMWYNIMSQRFGAKDPRSGMLRFHTQTAGSSLTAQQPEVNVVRTTLEALAAVLGGTQSLHTNALDEALGLPTEETARLALRTQQVIAYETDITEEPDPLGGAYYIEDLTDRIEEAAWKEIENIDRMGGALKAIESGYIREAIARSAYQYQREVEQGTRIIIGVNKFKLTNEKPPPIMKIPPEAEEEQKERVRRLRQRRDPRSVKVKLEELRSAALTPDAPLMEPIIEAAEAQATLGEIAGVLAEVWGEWRAL